MLRSARMRRPTQGATGANMSSSADHSSLVSTVDMAAATAFPAPPSTRDRSRSHRGGYAAPVVPAQTDDAASGRDDSPAGDLAEELAALAEVPAGRLGRLRGAREQQHERRIARRLARRDQQGLVDLHELTSRAAFSVILSVVRDRGHAEDVHQQVYAEAWRRAEQFDPSRGSLLTWVLTIARSRALDHVRRRTDQPTDSDVLVALGGGDEDRGYADVLDRALVGEALAQLPAQERELLRLRFWEGLSQTEIAERTGQPLGTVKSRMLAGLRNLKLHLEMEGLA